MVRKSEETSSAAEVTEWGRRVRAALALRGYDPRDLAQELNISQRTLERMIRGDREPRAWETARIVDVLEVPGWFIRDGLARSQARGPEEISATAVLASLDRIEALLSELAMQLEMTTSGRAARLDDLNTIDEVAAYAKVNPKRIRRAIGDGKLASVRAGQHVRIPRDAVEQWMRSRLAG